MSGVNKVILIGRLGSDPILKATTSGMQVCNFSLATSESFVKNGNKEEKTEWHRIIMWAKQAELAHKYLKKGKSVYIEGKLQTRQWEKDGQKHSTTEIVGFSMQFLGDSNGGKRDDSDIPDPESPYGKSDDSDIPF